jgi:hypothetical protein
MLVSRRALEIGAVIVALGLVATFVYLLSMANGLVLADGQPMFGDFIAFWSAGRAALDGHVADVHVRAVIDAYHQRAAPGVAYIATWNSAPTFLLIAAPLALLPYPVAALAFLAIGGAVYLYAARALLPDRRALLFALTLPAALYHFGTVQTGLLIAGITGLALHWLDRRPLAAGALVGLLAIKPHLALLWPLMLALSGRWRTFAATTASSVAVVVLAGLIFGFDAYVRFFENLGAAQNVVTSQLTTTPAYASLYASVLQLGAPHGIAFGLHGAAALVALIVAVMVFKRGDRASAGSALCAATLIVLPYVYFYDFTLLAVGAALLGRPRDRFELAALIGAWGAGLSLPLSYLAPLPYAPFAAALVLVVSARRESAAARRAPAPQL